MNERDIWAAALLLIDRHGNNAALRAIKRVNELLESDDIDGAAVWLRIVTVIRQIETSEAAGPIH